MNTTILIVDDEEAVAWMLKSFFQRENYQVDIALDAKTALTALENGDFEFALIDIILSDMDGFELLDWCRENKPKMHVFMMSGLGADQALVDRAKENGAEGYFNKVLPLNRLHEEMKKLLKAEGTE